MAALTRSLEGVSESTRFGLRPAIDRVFYHVNATYGQLMRPRKFARCEIPTVDAQRCVILAELIKIGPLLEPFPRFHLPFVDSVE